MLSPSLLLLSLFYFTNALSLSNLSPRSKVDARATLGPISTLNIVNQNIAPDGFNRSSVLVNGVFPAPLIQVQKGNRLSLQVNNQLTDTTMDIETSIHWHGIFQQGGTNYADGVAWVTQCPIKQQKSFQYQFNVGSQTGTYWYHSHYSTQYCDGLRGPLVVYDPQDPMANLYDIDNNNTVITLADWYHTSAVQLGNIFGPVTANSTLINGLGRYSGGPVSPLAVINVQQGLRYRLRVVSMSCDPQFNFTIDGHRMTIIEVDGNEVTPVQVDSIPIFAGQRYSVVVTANQTAGNYWIRAGPPGGTFTGGINSAILRYNGAPVQDPTSAPGPYQLSFDEGALHPLINPAAPGIPQIGQADVNIQLAPGINASRYFTINGVAYEDPPVPVLLQILSGTLQALNCCQTEASWWSSPYPSSWARVLCGESVSSSTDNVTIRFVTDNVGPWFLHCHIDWHLHHGFAVVMAEATNEVSAQVVPPSSWNQLCN
ncbi:laccase C [Chiua virens]|nr:laccase C [Chiua virens]